MDTQLRSATAPVARESTNGDPSADVEDGTADRVAPRPPSSMRQVPIDGSSAQNLWTALSTNITQADMAGRSSRPYGASPFELMSALGSRTSTRVVFAPPHTSEGMHPYTDGESRVNHGGAPRVTLPFQFDRRDTPYVPAYAAMSRSLSPAGEYATRMTAPEQEQYGHYDGR